MESINRTMNVLGTLWLTGSSECCRLTRLVVVRKRRPDPSDQACVFLRIGDHAWVKAGIEFDGQLLSGGVVTYPYSDW